MEEPPQKRFRYATYTQRINNISVDSGKIRPLQWVDEDENGAGPSQRTPFSDELERLSLLDLTLPFQELVRVVTPLTTSLPITLHNIRPLSDAFHTFYDGITGGQEHTHSGLDSALQLHRALFETCLGEAIASVPQAATDVLRIGALNALDPKIVERSYSTVSLIMRTMATFLLRPDATAQEALRSSWTAVRPYLSPEENKKYVRRCVADAWVGVLRKARAESLQRLVTLLLEDESYYPGMEAVWAQSLKGTSNQFQSRSVPIFESLLELLAKQPGSAQIEMVRKVVTAAVHHGNASSLGPLVEATIKSIPTTATTLEAIAPLLSTLSTFLMVRKGKRYPESQLKETMMKLDKLVSAFVGTTEASDREMYLNTVIGVLVAGKLSHWLSPGVTLIDHVWSAMTTQERYSFVNALTDLQWQGTEQFLLPHMTKTILPALESDPLPTLVLLNNLASKGYLAGSLSVVQGGRWRAALVKSLQALFEVIKADLKADANRPILAQLLHLLPSLRTEGPLFMDPLRTIISTLHDRNPDQATARSNWLSEGVWNDGYLLALALTSADELCLDVTVATSLNALLVQSGALATMTSTWSWNRGVLQALSVLVERWQDDLNLDETQLEKVAANLGSSDSDLRSSSLRILQTSANTTLGTKEVWELALSIEQSEMSLKNVRERTSLIARLGRMLENTSVDEITLNMVITYLLSQLKVNFRPLYAETVNVLGEVAKTHGEPIWTLVWQELEKTLAAEHASCPDLGSSIPPWAEKSSVSAPEDSPAQEEDEYYCPGMTKTRKVIKSAWVANRGDSTAKEVTDQTGSERLDVLNYEAQLLASLAKVPLLAEKHTRLMVPTLFVITGHETGQDLPMILSTRMRQTRTYHWLELFAKFVNPKAAYRSEELHALYLDLLAKGDQKLQGLALDCLLTYKSPNLLPYEANMRRLLDDSKFRDELAHFSIAHSEDFVNKQHRPEFIMVFTRLVFGLVTSRKGRSGSSQVLAGRKKAVLSALSGCTSDELTTLVDLMLEPFASGSVPGRQQVGFLSLLGDVLRYMAPQTAPHWPSFLTTTIRLVDNAQKQLGQEHVDAEDETMENANEADEETDQGPAPLRKIRTEGVRRLIQFIRAPVDFDFKPFFQTIFLSSITPRLDKLELENTQAPSATLDLIAALAANPNTASALNLYDERTLRKTFACLTAIKVKPSVIGRVFDIVDSLLEADSPDVLAQNMGSLIDNVIGFVQLKQFSANDEMTGRLLNILAKSATLVTSGTEAQQLATLLCPMLRVTGKKQTEASKVQVLNTLKHLFTISPDFTDPTSEFFTRSYDIVANLLQSVYNSTTRRTVVSVLKVFAETDQSLANVVDLVDDLNAYSAKRLDEPDFDRRLAAFARVTEVPLDTLPKELRLWLPLLRSALFFIRDPEELSIRTSASSVLKRFIDLSQEIKGDLRNGVVHVVLPGLRQTLKSKQELVRNEVLQVLAHGIRVCDDLPELASLNPLLGQDDDSNFFFNFTHIQVHRRARALRRLREMATTVKYPENAITNIFLPVLEHVVAGSTDVTDHHLVNEAITTIGALTGYLQWSRYRMVLSNYLRSGSTKSPQQRFFIRTVSAIVDHFHFDLSNSDVVVPVDEEIEEQENENSAPKASARITDVVVNKILPSLNKFLATKDENDDKIRIPLAVPIVKLASSLPESLSNIEILKVITVVSQILRSKDQDTRDIARDTMGKIAVFLGPEWLSSILKELQTALQRGPQKHVAAVVTHSLLVYATTEAPERFSDLDESVNDAIRISAEVIWGSSGKDAAAEGYKTKMREVRGATSRGFDTFQFLSRLASPSKVGTILAPIREIMHASQGVKTMQQVDETLRRVALGLNANSRIQAEDVLNLCYSLVSGNSAYLKSKRKVEETTAPDAYRVQMKRNAKKENDFYHLNAHKFVTFGLDLFVTAFRRNKFDFDNADTLSRLGPLVSAIGNTLYSPTTGVLLLALKASAAIVQCPIPQVEAALPVFLTNIFRIIKNAGGTAETEVAQTALKTLAVILRDCKASTITDNQLKFLIEVIKPDLEETDRQSALFAILKGIVSRRFVIPEIYDLVEIVSSTMVTNQSTHVQELCRGVLMQFLLEYPHGKGRLKSQMTFLARNLSYVFESGRISVMEVLAAIFNKFGDDIIDEYADLFFVALVAVIANDDSEKCRNMAGALIQRLFKRLDDAHQQKTLSVLTAWVEGRSTQVGLASASLAVISLVAATSASISSDALITVIPVIQESAALLARLEEEEDLAHSKLDHNVPHHALSALNNLLPVVKEADDELVSAVIAHLLFPHDWVRMDAAKAMSQLLKDSTVTLGHDQLLDIARKSCILLQGSKNTEGEVTTVDGKLADQLIKLLWNVGKIWAVDAAPEPVEEDNVVEADTAIDDAPDNKAGLSWLMSRMSFVARHLIIHRPSPHQASFASTHWTAPLLSILRFFAGIMEHLDEAKARQYTIHVLSPIYRILDDNGDLSNESGSQIDELRQLATEVRDFVQNKIGSSEFSRTWEDIRKRSGSKREERRDAKHRMAMSNPKAWADRKTKKTVLKKDSKKRKMKAFNDGRIDRRGRK